MSRYYPLSIDIENRLCLVVGGGAVAERKVGSLLEARASVRVVSLQFTPALLAHAEAGALEAVRAPYAPMHLEGACLVFAATDSRAVNAQVAEDAKARGLPVNVADAPEEGSFLVPATFRRGELCVSISTGGASPLLAAKLREALETRFGSEYAAYVELLGRMRPYIQRTARDSARGRAALLSLLDAETELCALLRAGQSEAANERANALVTRALEEAD